MTRTGRRTGFTASWYRGSHEPGPGWDLEGALRFWPVLVIGHAGTVCDLMTSSTVADPASWTLLECVTNSSRTNLLLAPAPPPGPGARFYKAVPR